jgi:hypothetical protein
MHPDQVLTTLQLHTTVMKLKNNYNTIRLRLQQYNCFTIVQLEHHSITTTLNIVCENTSIRFVHAMQRRLCIECTSNEDPVLVHMQEMEADVQNKPYHSSL